MVWLMVALGYLIGSIPTAYVAGRVLRGKDIRQIGDLNVGAQNAFRQLGAKIGVLVGLFDAAKGAVPVLLARAVGLSQVALFMTGATAVVGHNWPVFLGFRGGRGEATTIGVFYVLITEPMLVLTAPAVLTLIFTRNVILASIVVFVPLPFVAWWLGTPGAIIAYGLALLGLVAFTHVIRTRRLIHRHV